MPKQNKAEETVKTPTPDIYRLRYKGAANHYNDFIKKYFSHMIIPFSQTTKYFKAIMTLSSSYDSIRFCRDCKCFFRDNVTPCNHCITSSSMTIRNMIGQYKIMTKNEMKNAIDNFYGNFDREYITYKGWKVVQIDNAACCSNKNTSVPFHIENNQ